MALDVDVYYKEPALFLKKRLTLNLDMTNPKETFLIALKGLNDYIEKNPRAPLMTGLVSQAEIGKIASGLMVLLSQNDALPRIFDEQFYEFCLNNDKYKHIAPLLIGLQIKFNPSLSMQEKSVLKNKLDELACIEGRCSQNCQFVAMQTNEEFFMGILKGVMNAAVDQYEEASHEKYSKMRSTRFIQSIADNLKPLRAKINDTSSLIEMSQLIYSIFLNPADQNAYLKKFLTQVIMEDKYKSYFWQDGKSLHKMAADILAYMPQEFQDQINVVQDSRSQHRFQ